MSVPVTLRSSHTRPVRPGRRFAAVLACVALAGTACGSDGNDAAVETTTAAATETTAAAAADAPTTTAAAAEGDAMGDSEVPDIVGTALTGSVFTQLAGLAYDAGLVETLRGGPFTVFAPTDDAFAKLPLDVLHAVQDNPELLTTVLTYHVVPGALMVADLEPGPLETVAGIELTVSKDGDTTYINGNPIAAADVVASNGVVHVMGDVLVPPLGDIVTVATSLPGFATLAELVTTAGLVPTLQGEGPFTVFAPLDAAFEALPAATLAAVQADPALLTTVLTYHVVAGKLSTSDLEAGPLMTVAGVELTVTKEDGVTYLDGKPIALPNVQATNGVIHVMADVLVPES